MPQDVVSVTSGIANAISRTSSKVSGTRRAFFFLGMSCIIALDHAAVHRLRRSFMGTRISAVMNVVAAMAILAGASGAAADDAAVQKLLDRAEIQELVTRYVTSLDTRDADMYAGVFTEDGVYELPGNVVHHGRAAIRKIVT